MKRPNQKDLPQGDWKNFIAAVNSMHGTKAAHPAYREFVALHVEAMSPKGMAWSVHTMPGMGVGKNFLSWHRQFLMSFEKRLGVPLPYWDWIDDPQISQQLNDPKLLASWSVTRHWDQSMMPTAGELAQALKHAKFHVFQSRLEQVHGNVHNAVGGTMTTSSSPADPLFFLHHANIDRIWSIWQQKNPGVNPPNMSDTLMPSPPPQIEGVRVSSVQSIVKLGYSYT